MLVEPGVLRSRANPGRRSKKKSLPFTILYLACLPSVLAQAHLSCYNSDGQSKRAAQVVGTVESTIVG
jgi:hypothetical protein